MQNYGCGIYIYTLLHKVERFEKEGNKIQTSISSNNIDSFRPSLKTNDNCQRPSVTANGHIVPIILTEGNYCISIICEDNTTDNTSYGQMLINKNRGGILRYQRKNKGRRKSSTQKINKITGSSSSSNK